VLVLVTATDRFQARKIYIIGVAATIASHLGMAWAAHDFATGMVFRALAGFGWAGTYMVGLKALSDELEGRARSRGVAIHAAAIGISGALSYFVAGRMNLLFGWETAFLVNAAGAAVAFAVAFLLFPRRRPTPSGANPIADFGHVLRNRSAMAYVAGYGVHTWEMFTVRSWAVAFLTFAAMRSGAGPELWLAPTAVATVMELLGTGASIAGNELAIRVGRQRWVLLAMSACMGLACAAGFVSLLGLLGGGGALYSLQHGDLCRFGGAYCRHDRRFGAGAARRHARASCHGRLWMRVPRAAGDGGDPRHDGRRERSRLGRRVRAYRGGDGARPAGAAAAQAGGSGGRPGKPPEGGAMTAATSPARRERTSRRRRCAAGVG